MLSPGAAQLLVHPIREGYLFQDRAGTVPVTEDGQVVGRILDAGPLGMHLTAVSDPARGVFRRSGRYRWIKFNGVNTGYSTAALPAPGVDKAQVFTAVRNLATSVGVIAELSAETAANNGAFNLAARENVANYFFGSRGTITAAARSAAIFPQPTTNQLTVTGDVSGDRATLRVDGTQRDQATTDQGSGNYNPGGTYPLNVGARNGSSLFFNGHLYGALITRFSAANLSTDTITAVEALLTAEITGAP